MNSTVHQQIRRSTLEMTDRISKVIWSSPGGALWFYVWREVRLGTNNQIDSDVCKLVEESL